jgi:two-component system response regulator YesN
LALIFPFDKEQEMIRHLKAMNEKAVSVAADLLDELESNELITGETGYLAEAAIQIARTVRKLLEDNGIDSEDAQRLYEQVCAAGDPTPEEPSEIRAKLLQYVSAGLKEIIKTKGKPYRVEIEQVKKYIEDHYNEDLSLKAISSSIFMNLNYLCTLFKNEVGETINSYITKVRMEKAMELLRTTDLKVFEIAERVGYPNTNYFSYAFKKYTGATPNEFSLGKTGQRAFGAASSKEVGAWRETGR